MTVPGHGARQVVLVNEFRRIRAELVGHPTGRNHLHVLPISGPVKKKKKRIAKK